MAKKPKPEEIEEQPELEGEVEPMDLTPPPAPAEDDKAKDEDPKAPEPITQPVAQVAVAYFEQPEEFKHSFDLDFILDLLQSEFCPKQKACVTRPSGATLLQNTYRPIFSSEGIGGIRRESVFSFGGKFYKIAASCAPDQDQRFIHWDYPAVTNEHRFVMAQKVDPVQKVETVYTPSTE